MASKLPRPRSTTSVSVSSAGTRPKSRQSTASMQSNTTQPAPPYYEQSQSVYHPSAMYQEIPEEILQRSSLQPTNQRHNFSVDPLVEVIAAHGTQYDGDNAIEHATQIEQLIQSGYQQPERSERQGSETQTLYADSQDNMGENGAKRKKGAASSAANDLELRRLFRENKDRTLHEVASQVLENDKGPKSEKTKQIFGMLWLNENCVRSPSGSVPRSRVFSSYATGCGTARVPPLNPASFGKLVRIIFPGISTRRLGVRGESKYHYVELALKNQPQESPVERGFGPRDQSVVGNEYGAQISERSRHQSLRPQVPADNTAMFPSPQVQHKSTPNITGTRLGMASVPLFMKPSFRSDGQTEFSSQNVIQRALHFQNAVRSTPEGNTQLELPSIGPYLPPGIDEDAVSSLTSVYRSHCLLAIDNFRYCKTEKFCDSYKSLIGLLTVPGQRLLAHPQIAAWIRECDWLKYQKMTPLLDQTLLTQVPRKAMLHIQQVTQNLCYWISQFFQNQPQHIQDAMLGPANIFVGLLERYLRVNRACLDVAIVLDTVPMRDQLWTDWISHINPYNVMQNSVGFQGHKRLLQILTQEVRDLICPSAASIFMEAGTIFGRRGQQSLFEKDDQFDSANDVDASAIISRLATFLRSLPARFPGVNARSMLTYIDVIGNNIQRDLSLNSAYSLGNWWKIKVFIDEMSYWLAEIGGFQEHGPESMITTSPTPYSDNEFRGLSTRYRFESPENGFATERTRPTTTHPAVNTVVDQHGDDGYTSVYGPPVITGNHNSQRLNHEVQNLMKHLQQAHEEESTVASTGVEDEGGANTHDDSGIGMGVDDEFAMDGKYGGFVEGVHGSDPADVVVC